MIRIALIGEGHTGNRIFIGWLTEEELPKTLEWNQTVRGRKVLYLIRCKLKENAI